jgi:protein TonB
MPAAPRVVDDAKAPRPVIKPELHAAARPNVAVGTPAHEIRPDATAVPAPLVRAEKPKLPAVPPPDLQAARPQLAEAPQPARPQVPVPVVPLPAATAAAPRPAIPAAQPRPDARPSTARPAVAATAAPVRPSDLPAPAPSALPSVPRVRGDRPQMGTPQVSVSSAPKLQVAGEATSGGVDVAEGAKYAFSLSKMLGRDKHYPERAQRSGQEGTVEVLMRIGRDGKVVDVTVTKSSGYQELDLEAVAKVKRLVSPPSPPGALRGREFTVAIPIQFSLDRK